MKVSQITILAIFIIVAIFIPIIVYHLNFTGDLFSNLSGKNADWGAFGSFIGGVYGAVFSGASFIILALTLYVNQRNHNSQLNLIHSEQNLNKFTILLNELHNNLKNVDYGSNGIESDDIDSYIQTAKQQFIIDGSQSEDEVREIFKGYMSLWTLELEDEISLLLEIFAFILNARDKQQEIYIALLYSKVNKKQRFLLSVFAEKTIKDFAKITPGWKTFSQLPW